MIRITCIYLLLGLVGFKFFQAAQVRPVYNIAYMANNISEAEQFLASGANGLEIDVQFTLNGTPTFTYHGIPCPCGRKCGGFQVFSDFLEFLKIKTTPSQPSYNPNLALVHMNLRVSGLTPVALYRAGENIASALISNLLGKGKTSPEIWIILGVPFLPHSVVFKGVRETFQAFMLDHHLDKIGYDIYHPGRRLERLSRTLKILGIKEQVWAGTGSNVCNRRFVPDRLLSLVTRREVDDMFGKQVVDKVYYWVADELSVIQESFKLGVDAVMTNKPEVVNKVLRSKQFQDVLRLASSSDSPWKDRTAKKGEATTQQSTFNLLLSAEGNSVEAEHKVLSSSKEIEDDFRKVLEMKLPLDNDDLKLLLN